MDALFVIALIAICVWLWVDNLRAREFTTAQCQSFCAQNNVQMLDQSIHLKKIFPAKKNGRLALRRYYAFEFSINGMDRYNGVAVEFKNQIEYLSLLHPKGEIIAGTCV